MKLFKSRNKEKVKVRNRAITVVTISIIALLAVISGLFAAFASHE